MRARSGAGFTLIELIISVAIIATLATGAASLLENSLKRSKEFQLRSDLREMRLAIDAYKRAYDDGAIPATLDASGYPPSLDVLVKGVADPKSPTRAKIYFLRRVPADPMVPADASGNQDDGGWGLRSYASDPEDPQPGRDVFDVYSRSSQVGLNGVPYNRW